ncbi:hypothetical protein CPB86DRAFT_818077 [Serendipita vermifera]|nr:hypothetical protein CPB86DRAFT_818077 [Serendipita vermifera]
MDDRVFECPRILIQDSKEDLQVNEAGELIYQCHVRLRSEESLIHTKNPIDPVRVFIVTQNSVQEYEIGRPYVINSLMGMIQTKRGISLDRQKLSYKGVELKEFSTLGDYGISDMADIVLEVKPTKLEKFRRKTSRFINKMVRQGDPKIAVITTPPTPKPLEETPMEGTTTDAKNSAFPTQIESIDNAPARVEDSEDIRLEMPGAWVE